MSEFDHKQSMADSSESGRVLKGCINVMADRSMSQLSCSPRTTQLFLLGEAIPLLFLIVQLSSFWKGLPSSVQPENATQFGTHLLSY